MTGRIRVVQVGCGDIAATGHLPAIERSSEFELVGAVDPDASNRRRAAERYRVPAAADLGTALDWSPDAAIVAVPPHIAPGLTIAAIDAGLDVLCEKPMAVDLASAERVAAHAAASDRVVQIGFKNRFSPLVRQVRRWMDDGLIGTPVVFTLGGFDEAHDPADELHTGRILNFLDHGASFVHEGAHYADYLAYLGAGDPVAIEAVGVRSRPELASENFVAALVRYADDSVARLEIGWQFPYSPPGDFRVLGPLGAVILDRPGLTATLRHRAGDRLLEERVVLERSWNDECFDLQLAHFGACIRTRATPEVSPREGLRSLAFGLAVAAAAAARHA